jgi:flagellar FliL protein
MAEEKREQSQEPAPKKKKSIVKLIVIVLLSSALLAGGFFGGKYYFKKSGAAHSGAEKTPESPIVPVLWPMDPFVVNLMGNNGERYLKAVIQLEASNADTTGTLDLMKPKLRDNILDLLSSKSYKDLMDVSGKQRLREEIAMRLNSYLTDGEILKVYFTEFVIQ